MTNKRRPRNSKAARRRRRRSIILAVELFILLILGGITYIYVRTLGQTNITVTEPIKRNEDLSEETELVQEGFTTVALFGVDNRQDGVYDTGNSDTIIIVNINNKTKQINMMSVYRDSYINVYDDVFNKCNSAYAKGGPTLAVEMLNRNLDLSIDKFVAVDFQALIDAVNAVGGIEVNIADNGVANAMNTLFNDQFEQKWASQAVNPYVSPGQQTLNGVQALAFARVRKNDNDFKRTERQREVITQLFAKVKTASVGQLNDLADAIFPKVYTNFTIGEILSMASKLGDYSIGDSAGFPFDKTTMLLGSKGDIVVPCTLQSNVSRAHQFFFDVLDYVPTNTVINISNKIYSDTGKSENDAVVYN